MAGMTDKTLRTWQVTLRSIETQIEVITIVKARSISYASKEAVEEMNIPSNWRVSKVREL